MGGYKVVFRGMEGGGISLGRRGGAFFGGGNFV